MAITIFNTKEELVVLILEADEKSFEYALDARHCNQAGDNEGFDHSSNLAQEWKKKKEQLEKIQPGDEMEGIVRTVKDFGAFVDLGGLDGLIHISKLSWDRVKHPSEILEIVQKVKVIIDTMDKETGKVLQSSETSRAQVRTSACRHITRGRRPPGLGMIFLLLLLVLVVLLAFLCLRQVGLCQLLVFVAVENSLVVYHDTEAGGDDVCSLVSHGRTDPREHKKLHMQENREGLSRDLGEIDENDVFQGENRQGVEVLGYQAVNSHQGERLELCHGLQILTGAPVPCDIFQSQGFDLPEELQAEGFKQLCRLGRLAPAPDHMQKTQFGREQPGQGAKAVLSIRVGSMVVPNHGGQLEVARQGVDGLEGLGGGVRYCDGFQARELTSVEPLVQTVQLQGSSMRCITVSLPELGERRESARRSGEREGLGRNVKAPPHDVVCVYRKGRK